MVSLLIFVEYMYVHEICGTKLSSSRKESSKLGKDSTNSVYLVTNHYFLNNNSDTD